MEDQEVVLAAVEDLGARTLSALPCDLLRLVYLASTRDYNSGRYWHAGLATEFSAAAAEAALEQCHRRVFEALAFTPLDGLVGEVREYAAQISTPADVLLQTWNWLEPFRILAPLRVDPLKTGLFFSNMKIALEIVAYGRPASAA